MATATQWNEFLVPKTWIARAIQSKTALLVFKIVGGQYDGLEFMANTKLCQDRGEHMAIRYSMEVVTDDDGNFLYEDGDASFTYRLTKTTKVDGTFTNEIITDIPANKMIGIGVEDSQSFTFNGIIAGENA